MAGRPLRAVAAATSMLVLLGVLLFTIDQLHSASNEARARLDADVPAAWPASDAGRTNVALTTTEQELEPSRFEQIVTDANEVLRGPFQGVVPPTADVWTRELVPAFLALLLWGVGLTALSNLLTTTLPQRRRAQTTPPHWQ